VLLGLFGLAHALDIEILTGEPKLGSAGVGAALASFALLAADVVLPLPSSALMVANGALFGVVAGAALSFAGSMAAALLGFALGRRGSAVVARVVPPEARDRAATAFARRGSAAVILTRPVPVIAEATVILAGSAGMPLRKLAAAAAIGSLPPALVYALAGTVAAHSGSALIVIGVAVLLSAVALLVERRYAGA
jgi:uncharacterized membrane protein YdjX (TVP38/TMEM64 family)